MARVTIEDCTKIIPSRFELVVLAAQRAKEISSGVRITVDRENDKNPVIALREIAVGNLTVEGMREALIKKLQKKHSIEDKDANVDDKMTITSDDMSEDVKMLSNKATEDDFNEEEDAEDRDSEEVETQAEMDEPVFEDEEDDI